MTLNIFHNERQLLIFMLVILAVCIQVGHLSPGIYLVYASEIYTYALGYSHGCDDANISNANDRFITNFKKAHLFKRKNL